MVKIFAAQILKGSITIDDVPERWRTEVKKILGI